MEIRELVSKIIRDRLSENNSKIDTKVVDKNGNPLAMYHGGSFSGGEFKGAGWFTISKKDAIFYAKQSGGSLTKAFLIIKNPLYTGNIKHLKIKPTKEILNSAKKRNLNIEIEDGVLSFIEANGGVLIAQDISRDGIIDLHNGEIIDAVVFNNNQIIVL